MGVGTGCGTTRTKNEKGHEDRKSFVLDKKEISDLLSLPISEVELTTVSELMYGFSAVATKVVTREDCVFRLRGRLLPRRAYIRIIGQMARLAALRKGGIADPLRLSKLEDFDLRYRIRAGDKVALFSETVACDPHHQRVQGFVENELVFSVRIFLAETDTTSQH